MPYRILIVDDEAAITFTLSEALRKLGNDVQVVTAHSGLGAMEKIGEAPFTLVITDIRMPDMDGIQLTRKIIADYPGTTVIWMSAYGCQEISGEASQLPIYRCLDKPLDLGELRLIVAEALAEEAPR